MKKPNIILMFADDLGYGDLSSFNPFSKIQTKNLDKMAEEGMKFTNAHATSSLCTPSRYSLLTGRYNWRSALKQQVYIATEDNLIEEGRPTLASMLKQQGYRTSCVGKWHLGVQWEKTDSGKETSPLNYSKMYDWRNPNGSHTDIDYSKPYKNGPNDFGFDYFYGLLNSLGYPPHVYLENNRATKVPDAVVGADHKLFDIDSATTSVRGPGTSDFVPEEAIPNFQKRVLGKIDEYCETGDEPFFIYYPTPLVHVPLLPTGEFLGKSGIGLYGDFVLMLDAYVGEIMDKLEEKGIGDNTMFIFASDNGCSPMVDYPALISKGHNPSYIFRGWKGDIYDGGHRTPYIIKYPKFIQPGLECRRMVSFSDLVATIAELLGIELPEDTAEDSISNLSLLKGEDTPVRDNIVFSCMSGALAIQKGPWRLEMCPGSGGPDEWFDPPDFSKMPEFQLYNMEGDIGERTNVIDRNPEVVTELKTLLKKYITEGRSTPGAKQKNTGPEIWPEIGWMRSDP